MLRKIKKFLKGKNVVVDANQNFKPYFAGSGKEVDISILETEIDAQAVCDKLEDAFTKGEEKQLLVDAFDKTYFPDDMYNLMRQFDYYRQQEQQILLNKMKELYNEEEVLKLMENPKEFFQRGWCFPNPYAHAIIGMEYDDKVVSGRGYVWHFCLDKKFYENPENLYAFYKCAVQYFGNQARIALNNLDERLPNAEKELTRLFMEYFGFKLEFESYANSQYIHTTKLLAKVSKRLEIEPTEEDKSKQALLEKNLPAFLKLKDFTFKGEKLLIEEYKNLNPGYYNENRKTCGFEMM